MPRVYFTFDTVPNLLQVSAPEAIEQGILKCLADVKPEARGAAKACYDKYVVKLVIKLVVKLVLELVRLAVQPRRVTTSM